MTRQHSAAVDLTPAQHAVLGKPLTHIFIATPAGVAVASALPADQQHHYCDACPAPARVQFRSLATDLVASVMCRECADAARQPGSTAEAWLDHYLAQPIAWEGDR